MPGGSRSLPDRPDLRYLKLEAKRRLAAGEFATLHAAQAAIAREHGLTSWAALKQQVTVGQDGPALGQLRWVVSRFAGAGEPGWTPPSDGELRQHFSDRFLHVLPPATLVSTISQLASGLRGGEFAVLRQTPLQAYVELNGVQYIAAVEAEPPHRLAGLRGMPTGRRVRDPRIANPPVSAQGDVPDQARAIAAEAVAELGLAALTIAGGDRDATRPWVLATGWADLDRGEALDPGHRFPAPGVTMLVTATAVLRLVADGTIGLDSPANDHLRAVRLADGTITVRELLSHTAGVDNPDPGQMYADTVPELAELMGPVIGCSGPRGVTAAQQRRLRRTRPAGRRPDRAALLRRRHPAGARPAAPAPTPRSPPARPTSAPGRFPATTSRSTACSSRSRPGSRPFRRPPGCGRRGPISCAWACGGRRSCRRPLRTRRSPLRPARGPAAPGPVSAGSSSPPASSPFTPGPASKAPRP